MIVRIQTRPFATPSQRALRLQGFGLIALGVGVLSVWNPLSQPGPKVCLLRNAAGLPCPLCGMTRGVALCLRGRPFDATLFNPLTLPVLVLAAVLALKWAIEFTTGRRFDVTVPSRLGRVLLILGYVVLLANWTYMLAYRREEPFASSWLGHLWTMMGG